ncbi:MAG: hypothetical protein ACOH1Y_11850 [Propionicimonas sp.]
MSQHISDLTKDAERGLPDGLGSENTQPGPARTHTVEPESLVFGLGSADTQDGPNASHVTFDHTHDDSESGLPLGLGSENTQEGPPVPHPFEADATEFGLGSPETQHPHAHAV